MKLSDKRKETKSHQIQWKFEQVAHLSTALPFGGALSGLLVGSTGAEGFLRIWWRS